MTNKNMRIPHIIDHDEIQIALVYILKSILININI